ncbi:AMP-binding protein [Actinotignum sp. GS-2025c]|uniref:AMP-binding protein n=1 Tax=Actinotignum sp. GS-2025c TaxID=3427276 RepID=UPI003F4748B3
MSSVLGPEDIEFIVPSRSGIRALYDAIAARLESPGSHRPLMPLASSDGVAADAAVAATTAADAAVAAVDAAAVAGRIRWRPDIDFILQTSGSTTGRGHLVGLSARAFLASEAATAEFFGGRGRWVLALPAHHVAGFQVVARSCVAGSYPVVLPPRVSLREHGGAGMVDMPEGGFLSVVPTQLSDIVESGHVGTTALRNLRAILVGGAAAAPSLIIRARALGLPVVTTYGMTETAGGCVYNGIPLPGVQVAAPGRRLHLSGPMLAAGYLDEPESAAFITSGGRRWHVTNDAGSVTDGIVQVAGRLDDVIISGGVKVHARQVSEVLCSFPGVRRAEVLPVADARWGQIVGVILEADFPFAQRAAEVREYVRAQLGKAAAPRRVVQAAIPMLASGKVDRLRALEMLRTPTWEK